MSEKVNWSDYTPVDQPSAPANVDWSQFEPVKPAGALRRMADAGLAFGQGAAGATKALTDSYGAGNQISGALDTASRKMGGWMSDEAQAEIAARQQKIKQAEQSGSTIDEIGATLGGIAEAPVRSIAQGAGSIVPTMAAAALTRGRSLLPVAGIGAAQGAGSVKGTIYDSVRQRHIDAGMTPEQADIAASRAQEYRGENAGNIAAGAGLGAAASLTGAEGAILGTGQQVARGALRRIGRTAGEEAFTEGAQGGQERYSGNVAEQRQGFNTPTWQGVAGQAVGEGVIGGIVGGGAGIVSGEPFQQQIPPAIQPQNARSQVGVFPSEAPGVSGDAESGVFDASTAVPAQPSLQSKSQAMGINPSAGPVSAAAAVAVDTGVTDVISRQDAELASANRAKSAGASGAVKKESAPTVSTTPQGMSPVAAPSSDGPGAGIQGASQPAPQTAGPLAGALRKSAPVQQAISQPQENPLAQSGEPIKAQADRETPVAPAPGAMATGAAQQPAAEAVRVGVADQGDRGLNDSAAPANRKIEGVDPQTDEITFAEPGASAQSAAPAVSAAATKDAQRPAAPIDLGAHTAATSPLNDTPEPTQAQKEAGNYKKAHLVMSGLDISIENPEGSTRSGVDPDGKPWSTTMTGGHYGYVRGSVGSDGDQQDVFVKPGTPLDYSGPVFVIDQIDPKTGKHDEYKSMIGYDNALQARQAYQKNYAKGWKGLKSITPMAWDEFKAWTRQTPESVMQDEFERLYQEDVKDGIRARLGLRKQEASPIDAPKPSAFRSFLRNFGIKPANAADITGERGFKANARMPGTFRKSGLELDDLAHRAVEYGYLTQQDIDSVDDNGGVNKLVEMIRAELRGEKQVSLEFSDEDAQAESQRRMDMEIEDAARSLGIPEDPDMDTARLASMVSRVQRALDAARAGKKGELKDERIRRNAIAVAQRIEAKRAQYENELAEFANATIKEQNAVIDVFFDDDGTPVLVRSFDVAAEDAWNATLGTWEGQNGQTNAAKVSPARQAGPPDVTGKGKGVGDDQEAGSEAQRGDSGGQGSQEGSDQEILTSPTRGDVLAQQDRVANAQTLDDKAQIDREASTQTLTAQTAPEQRRDTTGDMFGVEKAQAVIDKRNASGTRPEGPSLFDDPTVEPEQKAEPVSQSNLENKAREVEASADEDGITVHEGKGLIKGKFLSRVEGKGTPGGPWSTPDDARAAAVAWKARMAEGVAERAKERAKKDAMAQRLRDGATPTEAELRMIGLRPGSSDLRWFIPAVADLFGISSRAVRPLLGDLIRSVHTDMGATREVVNPIRGLMAVATTAQSVSQSKAEATPKTKTGATISTVAASIRKAYGNVLDKLQASGLVTLTQTQDEAIEAAAQARAEKTGQAVDDVREALRAGVRNSIAAWHGTPHRGIEKTGFKLNKVGTGEGAQAYGWGMYFASARDVAEHYRRSIRSNHEGLTEIGVKAGLSQPGARALADAYQQNMKFEDFERIANTPSPIPAIEAFRQDLRDTMDAAYNAYFEFKKPGNLYSLDLPVQESDLLDWDKPLSEQSEKVWEALKRRIVEVVPFDGLDLGGGARLRDNRKGQRDKSRPQPWLLETVAANGTTLFGLTQANVDRMLGAKSAKDLSGEQIYTRFVSQYGSQQAASEYLQSIGIPGMRYLDGNSRSDGKGSRNYVIWDESLMTPEAAGIEAKLSQDGAIQGFYDPQSGQSFLIADGLTDETAPGVLAHEVGIHMAADKGSAGKMRALFDRAGELLRDGKDSFFDRVRQRMRDAGETSNEEAAAYIAEEYERNRTSGPTSVREFLRDFIAAVKAWLVGKGVPAQALRISAADVAAVARANVRRMAGPESAKAGAGDVRRSEASPTEDQVRGLMEQYANTDGAPTEAQVRAAVQDYRDTERSYGGRSAYDKAKAAGKTKLTYGQWVQVRTEHFRNWFGDWENDPESASKVVDKATGEPMVVYHGTPESEDFNNFNVEKGAYFTDSHDVAEGYTARRGLWLSQPTGRVVPAFLAIRNALEIDAIGKRGNNVPVPWQEWRPVVFGNIPANAVSVADLARRAKGDGSGLIVRNVVDVADNSARDKSDVFVVFNPANIKSATSNIGTFDDSNDHISFSRGAKDAAAVDNDGADLREPDAPYETDIFGEALPEATRRVIGSKSTRAGVRGDVQPVTRIQDTPAPRGEYFTNTIVGTQTTRELGASRIRTPAQAAQATKYLYKSAVERMDGIVTDKDGKVLAIVGGFKGAISQTSVYPATLMAEAVRVPGAANIWFSHNHPSGQSNLSTADRNLNQVLSDVFRGSGIEPQGLLAIAGETFSHVSPSGNVTAETAIAPSIVRNKVPVIERELSDGSVSGLAIGSPGEAKSIARLFFDKAREPGLILLNSQNNLIAWVPISDAMKGNLRGTGQLNALYRAISQANAANAIIVHGGDLNAVHPTSRHVSIYQNIGAALRNVDVRPLDSINVKDGTSAAESGMDIALGPVYARNGKTRNTESIAAVHAIIDPITTNWSVPVVVVATPGDLPIDAPDDARGLYHKGTVYLVASTNPTRALVLKTLMHEAVAHHGLRTMLGREAWRKMMNQIAFAVKAGNKPLREISGYVRRTYVDEDGKFNLTPTQEADEIAARAVEQGVDPITGEFKPGFGWLKAVFAKVAQFLRDIGFSISFSNVELQGALVNAMRGLNAGPRKPFAGKEAMAARNGKPLTEYRSEDTPDGDQTVSPKAAAQIALLEARYKAQREAQDKAQESEGGDTPIPDWMRTGQFARGGGFASAKSLSDVTNTLREATRPIGTVSWWDKTVGTQFHKSTKDADFKRVFDGYVQQTDDTAHYAIEAERNAPDILRRLESIGDAFRGVLHSGAKHKADLVAVSRALFANIEGEEGIKQFRYDDQSLRQIFNMTPRQIEMYHQARTAVDTSIARLAQTYAAQLGQSNGMDIESVKNMDLDDTIAVVKEFIQDSHDEARAAEALRKDVAVEDQDPEGDETRELMRESGKKPPKAPTQEMTDALMKRLDAMGEHAKFLQQSAYMPALRFGQFAVTVTGKDDQTLHFEMFESQIAANIAAMKLRKQYPGAEVTKSVMNPEQYAMFKGVSPETVELFAKFTGADQNEAFQNYIALAKSARSVKMRELKRKGIAGFSEDATRVLAAFLTSNARQSAINMNIGQITDALASKELARKGDVQREAQKLHEYMANPIEEARRLRSFMFMHFMGGSIASALVNLTQPVMQTTPYLHQWAGSRTAGIMLAAAKMAATGKIEDQGLRDAAKRAAEDGITEPHEIHQLMADASGSSFGGNLRARAAVKLWGSFFSAAEAYNRRVTFLAAYQVARKTNQKDPYEFARRAVIETQGLYSKVNRPNWARGAVGATIFTFKQFSIAYMEWFTRLPPKQKALAMAILLIAAGAEGLPFAEDLQDLIDTVGQSLGYNTNSKKWQRRILAQTFGDDLGEILNTGLLSKSAVDVQGRLGMGNLIPGTEMFKPSETDKTRSVSELAGPVYGVLTAFQKALAKVQRGEIGGYTGAVHELAPVALKNLLKGIDMAGTGVYKDARGYKVADVDALDSFVKMLGLQPSSIARNTRKFADELQDKGMVVMMERMIADRWAQGVAEKDQDQVAKARQALIKWNENNPESRIVIKPQQILRRVQEREKTRTERFVKTVPRELRASVAAELQ